jgi:HK97 family phage prohead protease
MRNEQRKKSKGDERMIVRTKSGMYQAVNTNVLFDFLGVKKDVTGIQKVSAGVELVASVPIQMINEKLEMKNEEKTEGFAWTLSTFDLDRFGERIDPQGWDFSQYMKNPVVEWAHNYMIPAIGKIEGLAVDNDGLHGLVFFNDKAFDPFGWSIGERVKAGVIRAGSVGFRVIEIEIPSKEDSKDGTSLIFRKQELLEFSVCNVPANPFALAKANEELEMRNEKCGTAGYWGGLLPMRSEK